MKPIIGITPAMDEKRFTIAKAYVDAITKAGGLPILLTYSATENMQQILEMTDGILFSGGGDIHAKYFNEPLHPKANTIFTQRDEFELALCRQAVALDKPVLAICRGIQLLNVACNGTLLQHIENHSYEDQRNKSVHDVKILPNTKLHQIVKTDSLSVNSIHHQSVGLLGDDLILSAVAPDGTIEGVEHKSKKFIIGVQWHPEALTDSLYDRQKELFNDFVKEASDV